MKKHEILTYVKNGVNLATLINKDKTESKLVYYYYLHLLEEGSYRNDQV